jgi:carbon monoxide dehydrogenase subunit G
MAMDLVMGRHGRQQAAAGRNGARRLFVSCAVWLSVAAAPAGAPPDVTVTEVDGAYSVHAVFAVSQPPAQAMAVLTDYERIPRFMPDVQTSQVVERTPNGLLVEQTAVSRFMFFSKRVHLLLEVTEAAGTIRFRDRCGKSFSSYEGAWIVSPQDGGALVTYRLSAKPAFDVPGFVLKRLLKRDAAQLIDSIRAEIAARAGRP